MRTLYLATTNPHKVREFRTLLDEGDVRVEALDLTGIAEPDETGTSFEENARIKALAYAMRAPGPVVSEDSGLEIDALHGEPGIRSARYLGPDATYAARFADILHRLEGVPDARRTARFVCALAVADGPRVLFETRGVVEGRIAHAAAGDGGFGYDPIFFYPDFGCTLAEAGTLKATVSHRAQAVRALARWLRDLR
ncbi:MAG: RdgB/HAM1 family non-canonical purine NTP pyrophosphatase [Vicinamibacterales bacterium]|jgi:XTP/dITP diphosphohydrolase